MEESTSEIRMSPAFAKMGFEDTGSVATIGFRPSHLMDDEQATTITQKSRDRGRISLTRASVCPSSPFENP